MDTVDLVLGTLALLLITNIGTVVLAMRYRHAAIKAQQEVLLLAYWQRIAGYDTGLMTPVVQVLGESVAEPQHNGHKQ